MAFLRFICSFPQISTMTEIRKQEPLILCKEDGITISCNIDSLPLPQHQIDGIRFLFAMFQKKKPGVILNDPSGYGKTLQVVWFLNAVRNSLKGPVLVLVKEHELPLWKDHFQRYADFGDDIVYESTNPFAKKTVFVSSCRHGELLARRAWAVAVLDDEVASRPPADFKICLLSADVKENLHTTLASYLQYLYPKEPFDPTAFAPDKSDRKDIVSKALLLDAFLEEIVLRRNNFTPFQKPQTQLPLVVEPPRVSRKNKDATGTKIKRSRPRLESEAGQPSKTPRIDPPLKNSTITSKDYYRNEMDVESFIQNEKPIEYKNDMDIESFIKNEKPIEADNVEEIMDFQAMIKSDANECYAENERLRVNGDKVGNDDEKSQCISEVNTADYQEAINDIVRNENTSDKNESVDGMHDDSIRVEDRVNDFDVSNIKDKELKNASVVEKPGETIQDVVNNGSKNDLESKIKDLEQKALNKFKGSLLDSIF